MVQRYSESNDVEHVIDLQPLSVYGHRYRVPGVGAEQEESEIPPTTYVGPTNAISCTQANTSACITNHQERRVSQKCPAIDDADPKTMPTLTPLAPCPYRVPNDAIAQALDDFLIRPFAHGPLTSTDPIATIAEGERPTDSAPSGGKFGSFVAPVVPTHAYAQWDPLELQDTHSCVFSPPDQISVVCPRLCCLTLPPPSFGISEGLKVQTDWQSLFC